MDPIASRAPASVRRAVTEPKAPRRNPGPSLLLHELERLKVTYDPAAATRKLELLDQLEGARFARADEVRRLHETLCFLRAYPDSRALRSFVDRLLRRFAGRPDLLRHARALADSGIAGTEIRYRFFAPTAFWLASRWPRQLVIDWRELEHADLLEALLPLVAHPAEAPGLDEYAFSVREWVERLKGPHASDAAFVIRSLAGLVMDPFAKEIVFERLDLPVRLKPGPGTPSRTAALGPRAALHLQRQPLERSRPITRADVMSAPRGVRRVPHREARRLIDLARAAMVTRHRDLDVFSYAEPRDVWWVNCGEGLAFAVFGAIPERRLLLESVYGYLTLKNGVPIGYVLTSALFGSSEIAFNVFETFRGAEAAAVYRRVLAMTRRLFGSDTFTIYPYQLGEGNDEALRSGAWWFYHKLGFRPRDPAVAKLARVELGRMRRNPAYRSSLATLRRLAGANLYLGIGRERVDIIGRVPLANIGLSVTRDLAERFGGSSDRGRRACAAEAARRLGVRSWRRWTAGERLAWERWAPLVCILSGVERWSAAERRALVTVIRAKGGPSEREFVLRFDRHRKLRAAFRRLAAAGAP
ncbi:MAG TPA: hypothetical protein VEY91_11660 [Candidatus Limnocylindria bacterium]|nr:hypothetical protein [Candidatus Limnocylindria bacterium]